MKLLQQSIAHTRHMDVLYNQELACGSDPGEGFDDHLDKHLDGKEEQDLIDLLEALYDAWYSGDPGNVCYKAIDAFFSRPKP